MKEKNDHFYSNNTKKHIFKDDDLVCYCFEYTKKEIEENFKTHGYSKILETIKTEKKRNGCHCDVKNPKEK